MYGVCATFLWQCHLNMNKLDFDINIERELIYFRFGAHVTVLMLRIIIEKQKSSKIHKFITLNKDAKSLVDELLQNIFHEKNKCQIMFLFYLRR